MKPQLLRCLRNKGIVNGIHLYQINIGTTPRGEFIADAAGSAEKVKHAYLLKIKIVGENIE